MNRVLETKLKKTSHFESDESSADVISPSSADKLGESTALSGSLSKSDRPLSTRVVEADKKIGTQDSSILHSVFIEDASSGDKMDSQDDPKIASNSKSDVFFSSSS